ncbi:helix-turn-helix protein [Amycolatopsis sulphurea]|uniref:Helix-turn-helix protein n=1 Tax=Amycolatopsis sulphurea TaxID=76022 RepID=A0A2A9FI76_9PSEU|nr:Scr1 family TA system antitoxin-like transcriptional regulator [Amycolatopsis sulphurea]PFG50210.1 helix-turn-helix protein [Amycolatopsis sulphurea]
MKELHRAVVLGIALRAARTRQRFQLRELARRIGAHPALVSNWEVGNRRANPATVARIVGALGVVGEDERWLTRLARTIDDGIIVGGPDDPHCLAALRDCAGLAKDIWVWHPRLIPEILQIPEYTIAVLGQQGVDPPTARRLAASEGCQRLAFGTTPVTAYISRAALTSQEHLGTSTIMTRQLAYLDRLETIAGLTIRVLPDHAPPAGFSGPFTLFSTYSAPIVHIPHHATSGVVLPDLRGHYTDITDRLDDLAEPPRDSLATIARLIMADL